MLQNMGQIEFFFALSLPEGKKNPNAFPIILTEKNPNETLVLQYLVMSHIN